MKRKELTLGMRKYRRPLKIFWLLFLAGVLLVVGLFGFAALGILGPMPELEQLENPDKDEILL